MKPIIQSNFLSCSGELRSELKSTFEHPREATERRFCWDYWHVPEQYTLLRTPAWEFFSESLYQKFESTLLEFGRKNLGCHSLTPPWLSCYVEGCSQALHADVPHGPWAYVYSLTDWESREFKGGETLLMKDEVLDYWRNFSSMDGVNFPDLMSKIEPVLNQLLVFDPRIPHGVAEVQGVRDPLKARLVIHGWFTEPAPSVEGGLEGSERNVTDVINELLVRSDHLFEDYKEVHGSLVLELHCTPVGQVDSVETKTNTLRSLSAVTQVETLVQAFEKEAKKIKLPPAPLPSKILLPILFHF